MTDYTIISKFRNKEQCEYLVGKIREKGKTCYNFCDSPADPNNPGGEPEEQMKVFEGVTDFFNDEYYQHVFEKDLEGLKNAETVIMLLPAGNATHMEAGIAFGLGKNLVMIGEPEKSETLYLMFKKRYGNIEEFLNSL